MNREIGDLKKILKLADRKISSVEFEFEIRQHQMNREMGDLKKKLQIAEDRLSAAEMYGSWCAYQDEWTTHNMVITFDHIFHEDSNMKRNSLNTGTGI